MEGRLKQISQIEVEDDGRKILLGTEGGNIYNLDVENFTVDDNIVFQDIVTKDTSEEFKVNPGAVEALRIHPTDKNLLFIGYARGLIGEKRI